MSVQELDNFRQKYPQYSDMNDIQLATSLANKHPEYSDLPQKVAMSSNASNPAMQGGANAPALIQARQNVAQAQGNVNALDPQVAAVGAAYNYSWPASRLAMTAMGQGNTPVPQATTSGGRMLQDMGAVANPLVAGTIALGVKGMGAIGKFGKNLIMGPQLAAESGNASKLAIAQKAAEDIANTQRTGGIKIDIANQNYDAVKQGYNNLTDVMQKQVSKYSDKEAQQLQQDLPKLFAQKSQQYGDKLQKIIQSLPANRSSVPASNIVQGMEDSLVDHGVMRYDPTGQLIQARTTLTPTEQGILDLYKSTKGQLADNPGAKIDIQDLMKNQQYLKPKFGKAWSPDDRLGASVSENISKQIESNVPEIKDLRQEYKPFLQWKSQVIKDTQPFNNQFDTTRSANLLSKVGSPNINPDEQRLVAQLQQNIGRQVGGGRIEALNKGIIQTGQNKVNAAQLAQQTVQKLKDNIASDVENIKQNKNLSMQQIDDATTKLINKYKNQRILTGVGLGGLSLASGGKLLEYFVRREASAGLHGG